MSENSQDFFINLDWNETTEELLVSWADIAMCYTWIYDKTYRNLTSSNYKFSIPIIILSTITGTVGIGLPSLVPAEYVQTGQNIIGAVNIFTGIITTLQNFFRYAQQSELSLTATTDWSKFYRNIKIELSIERHNRKPATEFVRSTRQEYERLLNTRPIIPPDIIQSFYKEFESSDVIKPEVLDKVQHLIIYNDTNTVSYYRSAKESAEKALEKKASTPSSILDKISRKFTTQLQQPSSFPPNSESSSKEASPQLLDYKKIRKNIHKSHPSMDMEIDSPRNIQILSQIEENSKQLEEIRDKYFIQNNEKTEEIELQDFKIHLEDEKKENESEV